MVGLLRRPVPERKAETIRQGRNLEVLEQKVSQRLLVTNSTRSSMSSRRRINDVESRVTRRLYRNDPVQAAGPQHLLDVFLYAAECEHPVPLLELPRREHEYPQARAGDEFKTVTVHDDARAPLVTCSMMTNSNARALPESSRSVGSSTSTSPFRSSMTSMSIVRLTSRVDWRAVTAAAAFWRTDGPLLPPRRLAGILHVAKFAAAHQHHDASPARHSPATYAAHSSIRRRRRSNRSERA